MITKFNISKPEKYIKDGVEKTFWNNVGVYTEFTKQDGSISRVVEIPAIGLKAQVFPITPRETPKTAPEQGSVPLNGTTYPEEINNDDIPF